MKHTKKQISEAIRYWRGILKKMNESNDNNEMYKFTIKVDCRFYSVNGYFLEKMNTAQFNKLLVALEKKYNIQVNPVKSSITQFDSSIPVEFIGYKAALKHIYAMFGDGDFEMAFSNNAVPV